jgi:hypothetical protein
MWHIDIEDMCNPFWHWVLSSQTEQHPGRSGVVQRLQDGGDGAAGVDVQAGWVTNNIRYALILCIGVIEATY